MAEEVHDTIMLSNTLATGLPDTEYKVSHGGLQEMPEPALYTERSLTGKLIIHRLEESGSTMVFNGYRYTLFLTRAEKDQVITDLGRVMYFLPHVRDEVSPTLETVILKSVSDVEPYDPMLDWWQATIELWEATGNTP
jgi:hypothetical protein